MLWTPETVASAGVSGPVRESWHTAEGRRGPNAVHSGPCDLANCGMMQDIEGPVVQARSFRRSRREPEDCVPIGRQVGRSHREGDSIVGELDEPCELFVIQRRVGSEYANRRPGSR